MSSLSQQAVGGVLWAIFERIGGQGIQFITSIVLARLLFPEDFALIGMIIIFFALASTLVDSGFSQALIREDDITEEDKSTTFFINFFVSIALFVVLWFGAPAISNFYEQPVLIELVRLMALTPIFFSFTIIQRATLTHAINFKEQTKVNLTASIVSGSISITLAIKGYGVWALAWQYVIMAASTSLLFWMFNPWIPRSFISKESFNKLFKFGSNILISGVIDTIFRHIYKVVLGKLFPQVLLGYFTQAENFKNAASQNLVNTLTRVTYPALSKVKDDTERAVSALRQVITTTSYFIFPAMIGMILVAEPMIITLVGEKWRGAIPILQIVCISGLIHHLHTANLNMLKVFGRSDLFLLLQIIKKTAVVIAIVVGIQFGFWGLIYGMVISSYIGLAVNMYYSKKVFNYSGLEQLKDVFPVLLLSAPMCIVVLSLNLIEYSNSIIQLIVMVFAGAVSYGLTSLLLKPESFKQVVYLLRPKFPLFKRIKL